MAIDKKIHNLGPIKLIFKDSYLLRQVLKIHKDRVWIFHYKPIFGLVNLFMRHPLPNIADIFKDKLL